MATPFADLKPFPSKASQSSAVAGMGHNRPPLDEMIVTEFNEGIEPGLLAKIGQLVERGTNAGPCLNDDLAGRYGDFIKMAGTAVKAIEAEREKHNRPILTAQRALKARADAITEPLQRAAGVVRRHLDTYMAEQRRRVEEERRRAEERARAAQAAAQAELDRQAAEHEGGTEFAEVAPLVEIAPAHVDEPVVRGDYGSRVGTTTQWFHEITSVRQVPDRLLKHPKVIEALDKVIAAEIRSGTREIKGVKIWSEQRAAVR